MSTVVGYTIRYVHGLALPFDRLLPELPKNFNAMMIDKPDLNLFADEILWELVRKDDRKAFMAIYDRYSTNLYVYILQIVGTRIQGKQLEEDTKEIIILIFETLWLNRLKVPRDIRLEQYLFMSAFRHALNYGGLTDPGIQ